LAAKERKERKERAAQQPARVIADGADMAHPGSKQDVGAPRNWQGIRPEESSPSLRVSESPLLQIGGFVPFTTVDFPARLSAVIFCQGCTWRCGYCHNPHLQAFGAGTWSWEEILRLLGRRKSFLEAVVFSGGEPTAQAALPDAIREVRALGYEVGLHTAGIFPERLAAILPLVHWVGLDIKAPFDARHDRLTGRSGSFAAPAESLRLLLASGVPHELRTTVDPDFLGPDDIAEMAGALDAFGAAPAKLQPFRRPPGTTFPAAGPVPSEAARN
jgi:pyruvate formate lyase activating enzyme